MKQALYIALSFLLLCFSAQQLHSAETNSTKRAMQLTLDGSVNPATAHFLVENIEEAAEQDYQLIIIKMNTPGGLDLAMRDIIRAILSSPIPVATYVYPPGSRAASAGTYILYASHVSAMAPATNLGAATPVSIGGMPSPDESNQPEQSKQPENNEVGPDTSEQKPNKSPSPSSTSNKSAMEKKVINDAEAYLRSLADYHGRNIDWVRNAVREGESLSSSEALEIGVIDLIAENPQQLLAMIDGKSVRLPNGQAEINTKGMTIEVVEIDWKTQLLSIISDPNIAYILLIIGIYGLIFEGYNPGTFIPGVIGAICLLLAFYALQIMPVNYVAAGLLVLGIALLVVEAFAPSFGILGVGGIIAFILGSFLLFNEPETGMAIAMPILIFVTIVSVILLSFVLSLAIRARNRPVVTGTDEMLSEIGIVEHDFEDKGWIKIHGEIWKASSDQPLKAGQHVKVVAVNDLDLVVVPVTDDNPKL
ncbi:NfeD family protein [Kangiella aquimarina]|uniref:Nodulation protein NfeD n=1 Tax=Kangiella aquimarina TaxID=261965 RepID=A0ABZ0X4F3_9GAMM|nr:nodulation protein NfeD [Kangiella aquimarina]WQG85491.1 nodulation protein NfeD [Kangiella aquimarina]